MGSSWNHIVPPSIKSVSDVIAPMSCTKAVSQESAKSASVSSIELAHFVVGIFCKSYLLGRFSEPSMSSVRPQARLTLKQSSQGQGGRLWP